MRASLGSQYGLIKADQFVPKACITSGLNSVGISRCACHVANWLPYVIIPNIRFSDNEAIDTGDN